MTLIEQAITIILAGIATLLTRCLPFVAFPEGKRTPPYIEYLGKVLPAAVFGLLVIYCLKDVSLLSGSHGIPELIAVAVTAGLQAWKKNMMLSIAGGTVCYMALIQLVFV